MCVNFDWKCLIFYHPDNEIRYIIDISNLLYKAIQILLYIFFRCDDTSQVVYINPDEWAYVDINDTLKTLHCPYKYCYCQRNESYLGCAYNYKRPDMQCWNGREGVLCGKCKKGYGLDLLTQECVQCKGFSWSFIMIGVVCVIFIVIGLLIVFLNPDFSPYMRAISFYFQMLPYVCRPVGVVNRVILEASAWLNFGGTNGVPVSDCIAEKFSSLHGIALGYVYPGIFLTILFILFILHKCKRLNFKRNSPFRSFWILLVLMYKFLVETSFLLLYCVPYKRE